MKKLIIPIDRQENVLGVLWSLIGYVENTVNVNDYLTKLRVEQAYRLLREIGYTDDYARWEIKK